MEENGLLDKLKNVFIALNKISIIYKILIPFMLILVLILGHGSISIYNHQKVSIEKLLSEKVLAVMETASKDGAKAVLNADSKALQDIANRIMKDEAIWLASFYDVSGKALTLEKPLDESEFIILEKKVLDNNKPIGRIKAFISKAFILSKAGKTKNLLTRTILLVIFVTILVFVIGFKFNIQSPLKKISNTIERLADGDLSISIDEGFSGEIGEISENLNTMIKKFNKLVGEIMRNSSLLAAASEEFSATSKESVKGASEQTEKINGAFESIQVFHEAINGIFKNSEKAASESAKATEAAKSGQEIIMQTVKNMESTSSSVVNAANKVNDLGGSSKQIGNITAVIREITNKTNLLALNAAIEAARAGEHGLGFAVVADEVRKLAERTTRATKEIEVTILNIQENTEIVVTLMESTTSEVGQSTELVQDAGVALQQIREGINSLSSEIKSIAESLEVQRETTDGIVQDIEKVSNVAQDFTVSAMETSKSSNELSKLASDLENAIHSFRISKS